MKKIYTCILSVFIMATAYGQGSFESGDNVINVGIGFGGSLLSGTYGSQSPAISASFEHGIWEVGGPGVISLGGYVGYKSYSYDYSLLGFGYKEKWNYTIIGFRGAYHYNGINSDKFDLYGGAMLSYNILSYSNNSPGYYDTGAYGSALDGSAFVGGRYYVSPNFGLYSELGFGVAYLNIGISFKF